MKVIKLRIMKSWSRTAATVYRRCYLSKPDCILGLTGSSPVGTYDQLAAMYGRGNT